MHSSKFNFLRITEYIIPNYFLLFIANIRYRPYPRNGEELRGGWTTATDEPISDTEYVLSDLSPGENFQITVDAVSHHVTSGKPLMVTRKIPPQAVYDIEPILGKFFYVKKYLYTLK